MMEYKPKPIDTTRVKLPRRLKDLTEMLANSIHDVWASQRLAEGWTWGLERDDPGRKHPCLIPYHLLPESEKEYDRGTALEAIKSILALGYRLEAPPTGTDRAEEDDSPLEACRKRCRTLRQAGEALQAYDELSRALLLWPQDARLRQLQALVLADLGAARRANEIMTRLANEGHQDVETLGILARTWKDLWRHSPDPEARKQYLEQAYRTYEACYRTSPEEERYYPGVNAATLAVLLDDRPKAREIAGEVAALCRRLLAGPGENKAGAYYLTATLAEACLVLGRQAEAADLYRRAAALGRSSYRDLVSTRINARLLIQHNGWDGLEVETALTVPAVAVFTGHIVDRPDRTVPRFPAEAAGLESAVAAAIRDRLTANRVGFGFSSAAAGSDIIFLETLGRMGLEAHAVLPYNQERFVLDSVDVAGAGDWRRRFDECISLLEEEGRMTLASDWPAGRSGDSYDYGNRVLLGLARLKARQLETDLVALAVWDGRPGDGPGGTASAIESWRSLGCRVEIIDLEGLRRSVGLTVQAGPVREAGPEETARGAPAGPEVRLMAMLFADVVGYSQLREDQVPLFLEHFMAGAARLLDDSPFTPAAKNTWGDAFYLVFPSVRAAGLVALSLAEFVSRVSWREKGLPAGLNLRVALHAGPVYAGLDPVTGRETFNGTHVCRAARIEPITPPGQVFASQAFAALAAAEQVEDFVCEYVGRLPLAKDYGSQATYHVRRHAGRS
ncbi:MAG: RyR domain-containing protein [Thermodesulfobacteriota bacterium]